MTSAQEAIQGAMDIIAEIIADNPEFRAEIKATQDRTIILESTASKKFEEHSVYETYKNYRKPISQMPSYAYLAITRAESEKQLRVKLHFNESDSIAIGKKIFVPSHASDLKEILHEVILDGIKRLLHPSLEREYRSNKKSQSDREAIDIFGKNVKELLLSSPVKQKVIMGFDPAYRTGCKIAIIDATGKYIDSTVVYPTEPQKKIVETKKVLLKLIADHNVGLICI